jgi:hypothetical protein
VNGFCLFYVLRYHPAFSPPPLHKMRELRRTDEEAARISFFFSLDEHHCPSIPPRNIRALVAVNGFKEQGRNIGPKCIQSEAKNIEGYRMSRAGQRDE